MISYIEERNNVTHTDDSPFGHYFLAHHQKIMLGGVQESNAQMENRQYG
jgi:hypothetical protein